MNLSVIQIGNSKGIRIPQSIIKQCEIEDEMELDIQDNCLVLKPINKKSYDMTFKNISQMDDMDIQKMLKKIDETTLAISLVGADKETKQRVFKNLSEKALNVISNLIDKYDNMDAKELIIEMHRSRISSIFLEM
ncbi:AbrB/MazE/SpoVT family DNA-binding domain-containing protein [Clostridium hydrogenum]|uniref:AbrB/MazE/SpoVT family DNA-binding domain-containing protein n=1 Tax=Clostridium hydrogenum TaxID=2855764 RepID=UPI001F2022CC|nr:FliG C-terminal domain-containing protein [Clostridium hydrogenum]